MKTLLVIVLPILLIVMIAGMIRLNAIENTVTKGGAFNAVNEWRIKQGLQPLKESQFLCGIANQRLPEIKRDFTHDGFMNKKWCEDCILSENLATTTGPEAELIKSWESSPTHREIMASSHTHTCIATEDNYVVQIFGYR
jgi:uncharacterized protein YkwD